MSEKKIRIIKNGPYVIVTGNVDLGKSGLGG